MEKSPFFAIGFVVGLLLVFIVCFIIRLVSVKLLKKSNRPLWSVVFYLSDGAYGGPCGSVYLYFAGPGAYVNPCEPRQRPYVGPACGPML